MPGLVHYIPVLSTFVAFTFAWIVLARWRERRSGPHLLWWAAGLYAYGLGTFTEAYTTIFGWQPAVFRTWYVAGALLGGFPLAHGTVYLLFRRRTAHVLTAIFVPFLALATVSVALTPLDLSLVETHRLSGKVIEWRWVRLLSPVVNVYALVFLVGGAAWSAKRFAKDPLTRHRAVGNALIAVGGLLPGIGGSFTRAGYTEVLYVTEFLGLVLIWMGYRAIVHEPGGAGGAAAAAAPG